MFVLGSVLSYYSGHRKGLGTAAEADWNDHQERAQLNGGFEARAYLRCLQAIDSGDVTNLHGFTLNHVRRYVLDVQQAQKEGFSWAPHIPELYISATNYLAQHPQ